jgi:isopentenyl-diphosphate delta-isomerase
MSDNTKNHNEGEGSQTLASRKTHHLEYAEKSQTRDDLLNKYFDYEPLLAGFPQDKKFSALKVGDKELAAPIWISSMTGGASAAGPINKNLARVAGEFGLGFGLGSCRPLLESDEYFDDFNLRHLIGDKGVFYANFGIAQVYSELKKDGAKRLLEILKKLQVDGVFVHVNPLQEWFQPEGDRWFESPLEILTSFSEVLDGAGFDLGVKEVGQGMGPRSLKALMELPVTIVEFGAFGGTNFSFLEGLRAPESDGKSNNYKDLNSNKDMCYVGHTALEMVNHVNQLLSDKSVNTEGKFFVISGGIRSCLQGLYLVENLKAPACYGMAKPFLEASQGSYEELVNFVSNELETLKMAQTFLVPKPLS